jgi:Flp pilus assembly CpaE family ATPase
MEIRKHKPAVLAGGPPEFIRRIREVADEKCGIDIVGEAPSVEDVYNKIDVLQPQGVLVSADGDWIQGMKNLAPIRKNVQFFIAGAMKKKDWDDLNDAKVMVVPADFRKAVAAVSGALSRVSPTRFMFADQKNSPVQPISQEPMEFLQAALIAFYSPKGGAGKTTVSVNAAAITGMWAKTLKSKKLRVAFLDFNCDYGDAQLSFGFSPFEGAKPRTVAGFREINISAPLSTVLDNMNYHERSNVYFLASPENPAERNEFNEGLARKILDIAGKYFHFVFVDLGVALDRRDSSIVALDKATDIVLVMKASLNATAQVYKHRKEIEKLLGDYSHVRLAVNQVRSNMPFAVKDIVRLLNIPLLCQIPYSQIVEKAEGTGLPAACLSSSDPFSREISTMMKLLLGSQMAGHKPKRERAGILCKIFGKKKEIG